MDNDDITIEADPDLEDPERNEDAMEEMEQRFDADRAERARAMERNAETIQVRYQNWMSEPAIQMSQLPPGGVTVVLEVVPAGGAGGEELSRRLSMLQRAVQAIQRGPTCGPIRCRYILITASIMGAVSAALAIYFAIKKLHDGSALALGVDAGSPLDASAVPDPNIPEAHAVWNAWVSSSEATFWEQFASYTEEKKPRPYDEQLLFVQFTADLGNYLIKEPWSWPSAQAKVDVVASLAATLANSGLAATYRQLPTLQQDGRALPRAIAASCLSLALVQWWEGRGLLVVAQDGK